MSDYPFEEGDEVYLDFSAQGKRRARYDGTREDNAGNNVCVFEVLPEESTFNDGHTEPLYPKTVEDYIDKGYIYKA